MTEERKIVLKELNPELIWPSTSRMNEPSQGGFKLVVIGKSGSGKSSIIKSILYEKSHIFPVGLIFSGTEDSNGFFSKFFPKTFIYNTLDKSKVEDYIKRQKIALKYLPNPWSVVVFDDCMDDPKMFKDKLFLGIFKNGRHYKSDYIFSMQYCLDFSPAVRTNIDGVFILRENILANREKIFKNFASVIGDFTLFCDIMDQLGDYTALYIHNVSTSSKLEDCVFFYKAVQVPEDFKFGCKEFWEFHNQRFDLEKEAREL